MTPSPTPSEGEAMLTYPNADYDNWAEEISALRASLSTAQTYAIYLEGEVKAASPIQLQARKLGDEEWTDIFPSQVEWMSKAGHYIRALERAISPDTPREGEK